MPFIAFIHLALAAFFAVHAVRSGRPSYWLFVLFSFPMLGSVVYFFAEYLPSMRNTRGGMMAARTVQNIIDPNRELREATIEARSKYGSFLARQGDTAGARAALELALKDAQRGHHHSRELNREWISMARDGLKTLDG